MGLTVSRATCVHANKPLSRIVCHWKTLMPALEEQVQGPVYMSVFIPVMNSSQYLVFTLLLFIWLWSGMTSSQDELISVPGIYLAAIYMALERDDLVPGRTHLSTWYFTLLLFTWLWSGMASSWDGVFLVPITGMN